MSKKFYKVLGTQLTYVETYVEAESEAEAFHRALEEDDWRQSAKIGEINITDVAPDEEEYWDEAGFRKFCDHHGNNSYPKEA
ncbi:MAG: hypothetical protein EB023_11010 [Flavobacteriia bacterium]|nr:hypothetical protein [Flavobacteriia bacterium]